MDNPFNVSEEKLKMLLTGYHKWLESDPEEVKYPKIFREQGKKIKDEFLDVEVLKSISDDDLYERIFRYSRKLEGPVHMRLGEKRLRDDLPEIKRNLMYILTSDDSPFLIAQKILQGDFRIEVFAKAFWSPILQARFPDVLPNWNNKTEKFLKIFKINISTSKLTVAEKYKILSDAFRFLSHLSEGHDFYVLNHLMHYGTVIPEGKSIVDEIKGSVPTITPPETEDFLPDLESKISCLTLNTILYGPPGTGKTYHCISHAVAIIEGKTFKNVCSEERQNVKERFEQYRIEGRIVFTTFHQSLGYEDFIEGIKPVEPGSEEEQLTYAVEDGIFKKLSNEASFSYVQKATKTETENVLDFSKEYDRFIDAVNEKLSKGETTEIPTRSGGNIQIDSISQKNNVWVSHKDGTRNYTVSKKRLSKLSKAFPDLNEITNINDQFRAEIGGSNSSAYWAILNAIRNQPSENEINEVVDEKKYAYEDKKEIIETLSNEDFKKENAKQYVLIIDEINRGNVSQIFGELITLIEDDKRLGMDEALKITLPYSKEEFGVPCNLHIIGTMNTADRSVEALDSALRRRFSFIEIVPKPEELKITEDGINLPEMLKVLNQRLAILKDNDHTIGHAWLWNVKNIEQLKLVFGNKILPLLREYFYNDYEKLGLVLGDAFFKTQKQVHSKMFASFSGGNSLAVQYDQAWQYQLKSMDELTLSDFKSLEIQDTEKDNA